MSRPIPGPPRTYADPGVIVWLFPSWCGVGPYSSCLWTNPWNAQVLNVWYAAEASGDLAGVMVRGRLRPVRESGGSE